MKWSPVAKIELKVPPCLKKLDVRGPFMVPTVFFYFRIISKKSFKHVYPSCYSLLCGMCQFEQQASAIDGDLPDWSYQLLTDS